MIVWGKQREKWLVTFVPSDWKVNLLFETIQFTTSNTFNSFQTEKVGISPKKNLLLIYMQLEDWVLGVKCIGILHQNHGTLLLGEQQGTAKDFY